MKSFAFLTTICLFVSLHVKADDGKYKRYQDILLISNDSVRCARLITYADKMADSLYDYDFAQLALEKAKFILEQKNYPTLKLDLYYKWGLTLYLKGNYEEADKLYVKALSNKLLDHNPALKAKILNMAAANLQDLMVYKRALTYFNEALELYTKLNDINGKATVYVNMANVFALSGNLEQSDQFFDKAGKIFLENKMMENYATVLGNKAYIKWKLGQIVNGKILLLNALAIDTGKSKNMGSRVERHFNLGLIYGELKQWDSCFYFLNRGKKISDSLHLSESFDGSYYYDVGYCSQLKGDPKQGISYYKKALSLKTGISNFRFLFDNISTLFFQLKQYDSAFIYKNLSLKIADSIYKSELQEHITFENKRVELIEKDYQNKIQVAEQDRFLNNLKKRNYLLLSVIILLITFVLLLVVYFRQYKLKEKKEHLESELNFLRAQLNPHFLFNSINNIYVLLDENKEKASESLLKFSDLLRYQLYECNVSYISLEKELNFLENFIEFEKLRYSNKITVNYNFGDISPHDFLISPLLLQPFIENAFKHTPKSKSNSSFVTIQVKLNGTQFWFEVMNTADTKELSSLPGGIGLENVKKRLQLLYPNKHELTILATDNIYKTTLMLTLTND